jgi:hypothetical protein
MSDKPGLKGVWSIGDPLCPAPDDRTFKLENDARLKAREESSNERIVALWNGDECVALYWGGNAWRQF